jgi:adenylate cyclase, class 2
LRVSGCALQAGPGKHSQLATGNSQPAFMAVEIEAKMVVESHEPVRVRLREAGAELIGQFMETNVFLDTEDRSLLAADEGLRLRANKDVATGQSQYVLTYKGPRQVGPLKSREEVEVTVDNASQAVTILERLGYLTMIQFDKHRESYRLDDCRVELDEMPHLGFFVEIEGPSEASVMKVRERLELGNRPLQKASYASMLMSYLQERGDARRRITFGSP